MKSFDEDDDKKQKKMALTIIMAAAIYAKNTVIASCVQKLP